LNKTTPENKVVRDGERVWDSGSARFTRCARETGLRGRKDEVLGVSSVTRKISVCPRSDMLF